MADTYTQTLRLQQPTIGGDAATWGGYLNTDLVLIDNAINGVVTINLAGLTSYTLTVGNGTVDQARNLVYNFTGALTANCTVTLPQSVKFGYAVNSTTGGFSPVLTTGTGGSTLTLPTTAYYQFFYCDSSNVLSPSVGFGYANFESAVSIGGNLAVTGTTTLTGTLTGQAINGTTVSGSTSVACGAWFVNTNGDMHIPYLSNPTLSANLNQAVTSSSSPTFADVGITGLGFLKASFLNQPVLTTSQPTFSNIGLTYLGNTLAGVLNQDVRTIAAPAFANVTINGVGSLWGTILNQAVTASATPQFANIYLGYLGDYLSNRFNQSVASGASPTFGDIHLNYLGANVSAVINQDVRTIAQPTFNNVYISAVGGYINNYINQDVRNGSNPTFGGLNASSIAANYSTMNGSGTAYHATGGSGLAAGGWLTGSDATFKANVETLTGALDKVAAIRGVSYTHKEIGGDHLGVIGQEIQEHFPQAVRVDENGKLAVNYGALVAPLIEAVKELRTEVLSLKARLA